MTFGKYDITIELHPFDKDFNDGEELVANYIEKHWSWLWFSLIVRKVLPIEDVKNVESLRIKRMEAENGD